MPSRNPIPDRTLRYAPALVTGVLLVLLWSIVLWFTAVQQRRLLQESERSLHLINHALAEQTAGLLGDAVTGLRIIDEWAQAHPDADPGFDPDLSKLLDTLSGDKSGWFVLRAGSDAGIASAKPAAGKTEIGEPQRTAAGRWIVPMARGLHQPSHPNARAVVLIDLDRLMALHDSMRLQPAGSIALVRNDGTVISRVPQLPGLIGKNLTPQISRHASLFAQEQGTLVSDGALSDGVRRLMAFRKVRGQPLTLLVTQGYDEALATYYDRRRIVFAMCAAFTLFAAVALWLLARAQRQSRFRQAELSAVSDLSPIGMFRSGKDGRLSYVNDAYLRIHGLSRQEAADGWTRLVPESARDRARSEWAAIVSSAQPFHAVRRLKREDGSTLMVAVDSAPVWLDGNVVGHVGTVKDISEPLRIERSLRTLTAILDNTTDFVVQTDACGRMLYMNPAARSLAGIGIDEPIADRSFVDFNTPATVERYAGEIVPQALERGVWVGETVRRDGAGREIPCSHVLIVHRDKAGRVESFSAIMRDISEAKSAQQTLQRSEAILRAVAEALPALVAVVDREQRYVFTNTAFERWFGASRPAIIGRTVREVRGAAEHERSRPWAERALAGEAVSFEKVYSGDSLTPPRHHRIGFTPLRLADGRIDGYIGIANDITEHRSEEARLREMARVDPLTGWLNRAGWEHAFEERARLSSAELRALLYVDLDRFKQVNDQHGHPIGDRLLVAFCERVRALVRPSDAVARLGGDEFAIILDGLRDVDNAQAVADKIIAAASAPFEFDSLELRIGASIGVALWRGGMLDREFLLQRADAMLYRAKQAGRGCYAMEDPG